MNAESIDPVIPAVTNGHPVIRKAALVRGHTLCFRDANTDDAEFILSLRTDKEKSRYLNETPDDIAAQREWLNEYATSEDQAYFIIEHADGPVGTVRMHDAREYSFCVGSLIIKDGRPPGTAAEVIAMIFTYALADLGFTSTHFDVRKRNERAWKLWERFGSERVSETEEFYFYNGSLEAIQLTLKRHRMLLPSGISVSRD